MESEANSGEFVKLEKLLNRKKDGDPCLGNVLREILINSEISDSDEFLLRKPALE